MSGHPNGGPCRYGGAGGVRAVPAVAMASVVVALVAPGVTVIGEKDADASKGSPDAENETTLGKPLASVAATVMVNIAGWPATTDVDPPGPDAEKPSMVRLNADEGLPPGAGLLTVMFTMPAVATSAAGIAAVSCEVLTKVVVSGFVPKLMTEPVTNFWPLTVSVKAVPPGVCV